MSSREKLIYEYRVFCDGSTANSKREMSNEVLFRWTPDSFGEVTPDVSSCKYSEVNEGGKLSQGSRWLIKFYSTNTRRFATDLSRAVKRKMYTPAETNGILKGYGSLAGITTGIVTICPRLLNTCIVVGRSDWI